MNQFHGLVVRFVQINSQICSQKKVLIIGRIQPCYWNLKQDAGLTPWHFPPSKLGKKLQQRWSGTPQHILTCQLRSGIPKDIIGDVIDTFSNTLAVNQELVRNSQIETSTCHSVSYPKRWYVIHAFSGYVILLPKCLESLHNKQCGNKQVSVTRRPILTVYSTYDLLFGG